jgi:hypothetical protein
MGPSATPRPDFPAFGVVVGVVVHVPGQHAARVLVSGVQSMGGGGGGGGGTMGGGGEGAHAAQEAQEWMPIFLSGLLSAESHHFDGWQRCGDVVLVADSQTHGLAQAPRWSVVRWQAVQLFAGMGSTQHATLSPPSVQARVSSGSSSTTGDVAMRSVIRRSRAASWACARGRPAAGTSHKGICLLSQLLSSRGPGQSGWPCTIMKFQQQQQQQESAEMNAPVRRASGPRAQLAECAGLGRCAGRNDLSELVE